ncbi:diaminopimelate epimerase [Bacillus carboniphilus]|uniref:Diaminopimelate epimerase n=1 Tax=Bacillus carboniphilus TaxID=86663 RepID=A0ABN0VYK4_9BACI
MKIPYTKAHGSRNDFIMIDETKLKHDWTDQNRVQLTTVLCDRKNGIGADGILFISHSDQADGKMRVFNSDGSEASMCGNGLRCVARYMVEKTSKEQLNIETMKATLRVKREEDIFEGIPTFGVEISPVLYNPNDLPINVNQDVVINEVIKELHPERKWSAIAVPNPHLITVVDKEVLESPEQKEIAQYLNSDNSICPDGVNVSYVVSLSKGNIFVRTYERGVGFTNACGTAMSASTLITCKLGFNTLREKVNVFNPGGKVQCVAYEDSIDLIGNATYEHEGVIDYSDDITWETHKEFVEEEKVYQAMEKQLQF